jgi:hypothetical protein
MGLYFWESGCPGSPLQYHPNEKADMIADYLESQFTSHDLCDENHERRVKSTAQTLLAYLDNPSLGKVRNCDVHKLANSLKLGKACGLDGIPKECLRHLQRILLIHMTHLFNHWLRLSHFPKPWKGAKVITLPKRDEDFTFPQYLCPISVKSVTGKLFKKVILKIVQRHIEERGLLNASQFDFRARHSTTF